MKYLLIVFDRIINVFKERRGLMCLYMSSYILCVLVFIYLYNNYSPMVNRLARNDSNDRYYSLQLFPTKIEITAMNDLIIQYDPEYIVYCSNIDDITVMAYYNDQVLLGTVYGRTTFDGHACDEIIFPENTEKYGYRPSKVLLNEKEYDVFGWTASPYEAVISCDGYEKNEFETNEIEIYLKNTLSEMKSEELLSELTAILPVESVLCPEIYMDETITNNSVIVLCLTVGFCAVMIVFGFLVKYIVEEERRNNLILLLVGASRAEMALIVISEQFMMNLCFSVLASLLHRVLFTTILDSLNLYPGITLEISGYLFVISLTSLVSLLITMPYLIHALHENVISYRRG